MSPFVVAVWLSGNALTLINISCSTPGPVSTGMGDRSRDAILVFNQATQAYTARPSPVSRPMSTDDGLGRR